MTSVGNIVWGPSSYGQEISTGSDSLLVDYIYPLDDADDALAGVFQIPKDGTVTKVGFLVGNVTGSPPNYKVGFTTISSTGAPQQTAYGGSSIEDYTPSTTGWKWITLGTSATVSAGDTACVHVFPGTSAPNGTNYMGLSYYELFWYCLPWSRRYSTSWLWGSGPIAMAYQYSDGDIYGFPAKELAWEYFSSSTTPDEVGNVFSVPIDMTVIGGCFWITSSSSTGSFELNLYDSDNTILGQAIISEVDKLGQDYMQMILYFEEPVELTADTIYRLTVMATNTITIYMEGIEFNSSTDRQTKTYPESERWYKTERTDEGSWTDTEAAIMWMGLIVSDISGGTSGSTGGVGATGYYGFIG